MTVSISGTDGVTFNDSSVQNTAAKVGMVNRIINGAMVIDQRNAGASITANDDTYAIDRFKTAASQSSKLTAQQNAGSVTPPAGFSKYLGYTSSSAYSIGTSDYFVCQQSIEGFNIADLAWGTASASPITLSFWVRSSLTGTFGGSLRNADASRSYPFTYTISAANTWEYETITIAGDTSGTWGSSNGIGVALGFGLGVGSTLSGTAGAWAGANYRSATGATSVVGTNGATFYITGVQLEKGSTATSFDYRPYGTELALCQRYFWRSNTSNLDGIGGFFGSYYNTTTFSATVKWPVSMRAAPTIVRGGTRDNFYVPGISATTSATTATPQITVDGAWSEFSGSSPTAGLGYASGYNGQLSVSAEL